MQNRRILNRLLSGAGPVPTPTMESNSMIALFAHVRTGKWATILPQKLAETLGLSDLLRSIPIIAPEATHTIGLVVSDRDPMTPLCAELVRQARMMAPDPLD